MPIFKYFFIAGAVCIEDEEGKRVLISEKNPLEREAMAKTLLIPSSAGQDSDSGDFKVKYVHRHLRNGDAMLLNRQPSLHKPSIMSHRFEEVELVLLKFLFSIVRFSLFASAMVETLGTNSPNMTLIDTWIGLFLLTGRQSGFFP